MPKTLPLHSQQKFQVERWNRADIKNCPHNPRTISKDAEKRLKKKLATRGLLSAVTVNKKTGNCVSGHRRLALLDLLAKGQNYSLDVCVVSLTPKQEREELIAFNNQAMQGDWDAVVLADFFQGEDAVSLEETGFDQMNLEMILGAAGDGLFGEESQPPEVQETTEDIAAALEERAKEAAAAKERRQGIRKKTKELHDETDTERLAWVVFPSREAAADWAERLGLPRDTRYIPCEKVPGAKLPVELSKKAQRKGK